MSGQLNNPFRIIIVMIKLFICSLLILHSLAIWTQMNNTRSGQINIRIPDPSSIIPVIFQYAFQPGSILSNDRVLLGIISFQDVIRKDAYFILSVSGVNLNEFKLHMSTNYVITRQLRIQYIAFVNDQRFIIDSNTSPSFLSTATQSFNKLDVSNAHKCLLWITGLEFSSVVISSILNIDLSVELLSISSGSYQLKFTDHSSIYLNRIYFNALFFKQHQVQDNGINRVLWGQFNQTTYLNNWMNNRLTNSILSGINSLELNDAAQCKFDLTNIKIQITQCPDLNPLSTSYSYINMGTNCLISCNDEMNPDWKICDKRYLNLTYFDPCHCPLPQVPLDPSLTYYSWATCLAIPYIQQQSRGVCKCINQLSRCNGQPNCNNQTRCYFSAEKGNVIITNFTKVYNQNILNFIGKASVNQSIYTHGALISNVLEFQGMDDCCSVQFELLNNETIMGHITYSSNIHLLQFKSKIHFSRFSHTNFGYEIFEFSKTLDFSRTILTANGLLAYAYPQSLYQQLNVIEYFIYVLIGMVLVNVVLGFLNKYNIVGLEMIGVLQLTYFALPLAGQYRSPLIASMKQLKYINGYNLDLGGNLIGAANHFNLSLSGLYLSPLQNINLMLILLILPLFFCLVLTIISYIHKMQKTTYKMQAMFMLGEYIYIALIYLLYPISFNLGMFLMTMKERPQQFMIMSVVELACFFVVLIVMCALYIRSNETLFGEFKYSFKVNKFSSNCYYLIPVLERIAIGGALGALNTSYISAVVGIVLLLVTAAVTLVKKPFAEKFSNERVAANKLLSALILGVYIFLNFFEETTSQLALYSPYLLLILALLSTIISLLFTIQRTILSCRRDQRQKMLQKGQNIDQMKQSEINKQLLKTLQQGFSNKSVQNPAIKRLYKKITKKRKRKTVGVDLGDLDWNYGIDESEDVNGLTPARVKMVHHMLREGQV